MPSAEKNTNLRLIAVAVTDGTLCMHFGHCKQFALIDVDLADKAVLGSSEVDPPPHEPGLLPRWLRDQGVNLVIAGGMGARAQDIFAENGIDVVVGAPPESPMTVVEAYLQGSLQQGENPCDH